MLNFNNWQQLNKRIVQKNITAVETKITEGSTMSTVSSNKLQINQ